MRQINKTDDGKRGETAWPITSSMPPSGCGICSRRPCVASLGAMKTQMAAAKQSVSGLSDKLTEHERIQKRTAKSIKQTGSKISGLSDKMALLSAPILAAATAGFKLHGDFANGIAKISTLVDTKVVSMQKVSDEIRASGTIFKEPLAWRA